MIVCVFCKWSVVYKHARTWIPKYKLLLVINAAEEKNAVCVCVESHCRNLSSVKVVYLDLCLLPGGKLRLMTGTVDVQTEPACVKSVCCPCDFTLCYPLNSGFITHNASMVIYGCQYLQFSHSIWFLMLFQLNWRWGQTQIKDCLCKWFSWKQRIRPETRCRARDISPTMEF